MQTIVNKCFSERTKKISVELIYWWDTTKCFPISWIKSEKFRHVGSRGYKYEVKLAAPLTVISETLHENFDVPGSFSLNKHFHLAINKTEKGWSDATHFFSVRENEQSAAIKREISGFVLGFGAEPNAVLIYS